MKAALILPTPRLPELLASLDLHAYTRRYAVNHAIDLVPGGINLFLDNERHLGRHPDQRDRSWLRRHAPVAYAAGCRNTTPLALEAVLDVEGRLPVDLIGFDGTTGHSFRNIDHSDNRPDRWEREAAWIALVWDRRRCRHLGRFPLEDYLTLP